MLSCKLQCADAKMLTWQLRGQPSTLGAFTVGGTHSSTADTIKSRYMHIRVYLHCEMRLTVSSC